VIYLHKIHFSPKGDANLPIRFRSQSISFLFFFFSYFFKDFIHLFDRESTSRKSSKQREREKQDPHWAESLTPSLIPGPWDHDLSWRQILNQLTHPRASQTISFLSLIMAHIISQARLILIQESTSGLPVLFH